MNITRCISRVTGNAIACVLTLLITGASAMAAMDPDNGDVRDLRVGTAVADLPGSGYVGFACARDGVRNGPELQSWSQYRKCPPDAAGRREIGFRYDDAQAQWAAVNDKWEGTKISGHPVLLSLLIGDTGVVEGVRILTDPEARLYLRKKAFLLRLRIKGRYGSDGWDCKQAEPANGETALGGMYINETCSKRYKNRDLLMTTRLYRAGNQSAKEFTSSTRLEILAASP